MAVLSTFQKMVKILTVFWDENFCFWKKVFNSLKYQINAKFYAYMCILNIFSGIWVDTWEKSGQKKVIFWPFLAYFLSIFGHFWVIFGKVF